MRLTSFKLASMLCVGLGLAGHSMASGIEYVFKGIATGSVGSTSFTETPYTITLVSDTNNVTNPFSKIFANEGTATFSLLGGPSGTFTGPVSVFDNQSNPGLVGFTPITSGLGSNDVIQLWDSDISSTFFLTYDLKSTTALMGPGPNASLVSFQNIETDQGLMSMSWMAENTFQASAVPEPTTIAVLGVGVAALIKRRRR